MTEFPVPDCLVLKLEENEADSKNIDTTVYIFYDKKEHNYVIRGQRRCSDNIHSCTYSFVSEHLNSVADFLQYVICSNNTVNEILYNFDSLPIDSNEITYELLKKYDDVSYELSGYNNK